MERATKTWIYGLLIATSVCAASSSTRASDRQFSVARELHRARTELAHYNLANGGTFATISTLARIEQSNASDAAKLEARFLRSVASFDLWLIASIRGDAPAIEKVAQAYGQTSERLPGELKLALQRVAFGHYESAAKDALHALELWPQISDPKAVRAHAGQSGPRHDFLYCVAVRKILDEPDTNPAIKLSELAVDPCQGARSCPPLYASFDGEGRKAIRAIEAATQAVERLGEARRGGDPFSFATAEMTEEFRMSIRSVVLKPTVQIPSEFADNVAPQAATDSHTDLAAVITATEVRFGWLPQVRVSETGAPETFATSSPLVGEPSAVAIPLDLRPIVKSIPEVAQALRTATPSASERTIAFGVHGEVPSHVLARVLLSAKEAGYQKVMLLSRAADGTPRVLPVTLTRLDRDAEDSPVEVQLRLGGYAVNTRGGSDDLIPRVRTEHGLQFDIAALVTRLSAFKGTTLPFKYMPSVASQELIAAAFAVAKPDRSIAVVVP